MAAIAFDVVRVKADHSIGARKHPLGAWPAAIGGCISHTCSVIPAPGGKYGGKGHPRLSYIIVTSNTYRLPIDCALARGDGVLASPAIEKCAFDVSP